MRIRFDGVYTVEELFQALWQERRALQEMGISHIRGANLYCHPVDQYGDPLTPRYKNGEPIEGWTSRGAYHSAAHDYGL